MGGDNDLVDEIDEKLLVLIEVWDRFLGYLLIYQDKKGVDSICLLEVCLDEQGEKVIKILVKYKQENLVGVFVFVWVVNEVMVWYFFVDLGLIVFFYISGWLLLGMVVVLVGIICLVIKDNYYEMSLQDFVLVILDG